VEVASAVLKLSLVFVDMTSDQKENIEFRFCRLGFFEDPRKLKTDKKIGKLQDEHKQRVTNSLVNGVSKI